MAFTDFYMNTSGNDLNSGSTCSDVGGGSNSPSYTSLAGNWSTSTNQFTPTDGSTPASTVNVGDYVSIYLSAATVAVFVAQVTVVASGVNGAITVSSTIRYGTPPVTGSGTVALRDGGAILSLANTAFTAAQTVPQSTRINVKAATYANTTNTRTLAIAGSATVGMMWRGYQTTPGDQDTQAAMAVAVAGTNIPYFTFTGSSAYFAASGRTRFSRLSLSPARSRQMPRCTRQALLSSGFDLRSRIQRSITGEQRSYRPRAASLLLDVL